MTDSHQDIIATGTWLARRICQSIKVLEEKAEAWELHAEGEPVTYHTLSRPMNLVDMHNRITVLFMQQMGEAFQKGLLGQTVGSALRSALQQVDWNNACFSAIEDYGDKLAATHPHIEEQYDKILLLRAQGKTEHASEDLRAMLKTCPAADASESILQKVGQILEQARKSCMDVVETAVMMNPEKNGHA